MFLVKKLWIDPLENRNAYGYNVVGFARTKEEADRICNSEFVKKSDYPWPLDYCTEFKGDFVPRYTATELVEFVLK